jgi:hypothetical protein
MEDLEKRILHAAEELRQVTRDYRPPGSPERRFPTPAGWLAFAVGFGLVALAIGILPSLLGSDQGPAGTTGTTSPVVVPSTAGDTTITTTPVTTVPSVECSSTGVEAPPVEEGLPDPVSEARAAIIAAALSCDYDALVALAGEPFTTSFGGGGSEMFQEWEETGQGKLGILVRLLGLSHARQEFEGDAAEVLGSSVLYVWPAAFDYDSWEEIPQELIDELLVIYTQEEIDQIAGFGSYAGWRTGITAEGDWVFFVAGD